MAQTTCQRCDHTWDYQGGKDRGDYCSCPKCATSVKVGRGHEPQDGEGTDDEDTDDATGHFEAPKVVLETGDVREELSIPDAIQRIHEHALATGQAQEIHRRQVERVDDDVDDLKEAVREVANVLKDWMEKEYPPEENDWDGVEYEADLLQPRQEFRVPAALRGEGGEDANESAVYEAVEATDE